MLELGKHFSTLDILGGSKGVRGRERTGDVGDTPTTPSDAIELVEGERVQVGDMGQRGDMRAGLVQKLLSSVALGIKMPLLESFNFEASVLPDFW